MIFNCTRGGRAISARYTDNAPITLDAEPVPGGVVVLKGDLGDRPTAIFGVETQDDADWYGIALDTPRYQRHDCRGAA